MHDPGDTRDAPGALAWIAAALIAAPALIRASVMIAPFPHWDVDPFAFGGAQLAVGPSAMIALDALACVGCALALVTARRVLGWVVAAFALGAVGVLIHAWGSIEHLGEGSHWIGALASGVGAAHLAQHAPIKRLILACVLGWTGLLIADGAHQYLVEHPLTVAAYEQNRDAFLAAKGWLPDSNAAAVYERRLRQPAATGWFGLSNVFATFAAGGAVALGALAIALWRRGTRGAASALTLGVIACLGGLAMTGAKGAWAAAGAGAIAAAGLTVIRRHAPLARLAPACAMCVPIGVLALVVVRGLLGERLGDLSILFRWFYLQGAFDAWRANPLLGVGPGGFKDAYLLARPALSPEEVSSPHALAVDWIACLGLFGMGWCAVLGWMGWRAGANARGESPTGGDTSRIGTETRVVFIVSALVVAISAWIEREALTPEGAMSRVVGIVAWVAIGWSVLRAMASVDARAALGAGALAMIAHAHLDLTGVHIGAAALLMTTIGIAVGREPSATDETSETGKPEPGRRLRLGWAAAPVAIAGMVVVLAVPIARWESALDRAARAADAFRAQTQSQAQNQSLALAPNAPPVDVTPYLAEARVGLEAALAARPTHRGTREALARVILTSPGAGPADARAVLDLAEGGVVATPDSAGAWMWLGTAWEGLATDPRFALDGGSSSLRVGAAQAWERAAALDPNGLEAPRRLMRQAHARGKTQAARAWARRCLEVDAALRLDPLKQFSAEDRALAQRLAASVPPEPDLDARGSQAPGPEAPGPKAPVPSPPGDAGP